jgi:hypothetical protein
MRSIRLSGDYNRAASHIPEAQRLLYLLESRLNPEMGVASLTEHKTRYDGTRIHVMSSLMPPSTTVASYAYISSPFIGGEEEEEAGFILYLVTIAIPERADSDLVEFTDYDVDGKHVCKTYPYKLNPKTGKIKRTTDIITLTHNNYTVGGGLTLTLQEGFLVGKQSHYAQLSNVYNHEEEIGSLDWRNFQNGGGWSLYNYGNPDKNTYWGYAIPRFMKMATYGADKALKNPSPLSTLSTSYAARKNYVVSGKDITYTDLVYVRNVIQQYFAPDYWGWDYGQAMFSGIVEVLNPNYRWMFYHYIHATDFRTGATKSTLIGTDENSASPAGGIGLNWKYHVPIMLVTDSKALMRIVEREGTDKTCWTAELDEKLVIGNSDNHSTLRQLALATNGGLSATEVIGADMIYNNTSEGYYLDGCQQNDQTFTFTGGGGYTVSGNSIIAGSAVCGEITATGTCVSCGITATKKVYGQGNRYVQIGYCVIQSNWWCFGGGTFWTFIDDFPYYYACGQNNCFNLSGGSTCADVTYDCTGDCSIELPCYSCTNQGGGVNVTMATTCYVWGC